MATEDDLFSATSAPQNEERIFEDNGEKPILVDPNKDYLTEYVGEGKKFKDPADLARAKAHSDAFIERLQRELSGIRTELNTRVKLEELMDRMSATNTDRNVNSQATQTAGENGQDGTASKNLSSEDIERVIEQRLQAKEQERLVANNVQAVKSRLVSEFGDNYVAELEARTKSLGLSKDFVADIAKREPRALFALLGLDSAGSQQKSQNDLFTPPRSSVNTAGFSATGTSEKKFEDFEKIRKQDPTRYWSAQVQNELHKQAMKLGEKFYS
jgi:chromatin segregation and condensation protein Rec8/ScpA/Scc1 (kleisin family)